MRRSASEVIRNLEQRVARLERQSAREPLGYTLYTEIEGEDINEYDRTHSGYSDPKFYTWPTLEEAKRGLAHHMFEGRLSRDGMRKTYFDEDEGFEGADVSYIIRPVYNERDLGGFWDK